MAFLTAATATATDGRLLSSSADSFDHPANSIAASASGLFSRKSIKPAAAALPVVVAFVGVATRSRAMASAGSIGTQPKASSFATDGKTEHSQGYCVSGLQNGRRGSQEKQPFSLTVPVVPADPHVRAPAQNQVPRLAAARRKKHDLLPEHACRLDAAHSTDHILRSEGKKAIISMLSGCDRSALAHRLTSHRAVPEVKLSRKLPSFTTTRSPSRWMTSWSPVMPSGLLCWTIKTLACIVIGTCGPICVTVPETFG